MDLAIQATSFIPSSPVQSRVGSAMVAPQPAAQKPETSARNAQEDSSLSQARQQTQRSAQAANQSASNLISRTRTDFEYEEALSVMKVTDKDVLIYQVPAKGALEIIQAEAKEASRIQATA